MIVQPEATTRASACQKVQFVSRKQAEKAKVSLMLRDVRRGSRAYARSYRCECGWWHLTSQGKHR